MDQIDYRFIQALRKTWQIFSKHPRFAMRNYRKFWQFYLNIRPINGHLEYVRFIILGRRRTGSTLLRGLLSSHRQIISLGEIFQKYPHVDLQLPLYRESKSLLSLGLSDPIEFLETKVFRKYPRLISAVGFKIFYNHAQNEHWKSVWEHLKSQKDLKVIHMKRKNILRTILSTKVAARLAGTRHAGTWIDISRPPEDNSELFLDYEECLRRFTRIRENERAHDILFGNHHKMEVFYETLSGDYHREMKRIQEFLGVNHEAVKPITYKRASQPLHKAISNYFELKERFKETPWEEFFDDQA